MQEPWNPKKAPCHLQPPWWLGCHKYHMNYIPRYTSHVTAIKRAMFQRGQEVGYPLIHRGRMTHICVGKLTIIGSDNGLSPGRRQAIIKTNAGILSIGPLGTNLSEILIEMHTFLLIKIHLKMSSGKWEPFFLGLNVYLLLVVSSFHSINAQCL